MDKFSKSVKDLFSYLHSHVVELNNSKLFAGLMIIILNIASKFVTFKLSKSMESYLKFTFSKQVLVFAMAWMGTRDIYIALFMTICFTIFIEYLFNEESPFCCLSEDFTDYHVSLLDEQVSDDDIRRAKEVLEKAEKQANLAKGKEKI
jgi:uncharacterized membrane protein